MWSTKDIRLFFIDGVKSSLIYEGVNSIARTVQKQIRGLKCKSAFVTEVTKNSIFKEGLNE